MPDESDADFLFKSAPEHVKKLHKESKKLHREIKRKQWWEEHGKPSDKKTNEDR